MARPGRARRSADRRRVRPKLTGAPGDPLRGGRGIVHSVDGPARAFTLLHDARPVLLNRGEPGDFDLTPWADRVNRSMPNMLTRGSSQWSAKSQRSASAGRASRTMVLARSVPLRWQVGLIGRGSSGAGSPSWTRRGSRTRPESPAAATVREMPPVTSRATLRRPMEFFPRGKTVGRTCGNWWINATRRCLQNGSYGPLRRSPVP